MSLRPLTRSSGRNRTVGSRYTLLVTWCDDSMMMGESFDPDSQSPSHTSLSSCLNRSSFSLSCLVAFPSSPSPLSACTRPHIRSCNLIESSLALVQEPLRNLCLRLHLLRHVLCVCADSLGGAGGLHSGYVICLYFNALRNPSYRHRWARRDRFSRFVSVPPASSFRPAATIRTRRKKKKTGITWQQK